MVIKIYRVERDGKNFSTAATFFSRRRFRGSRRRLSTYLAASPDRLAVLVSEMTARKKRPGKEHVGGKFLIPELKLSRVSDFGGFPFFW